MSKKNIRHFLAACFALGWASIAHADISVTPVFNPSNQVQPPDTTDYEGIFYDFSSTFPPGPIPIATFNFTIPAGYYVTAATISGTFGDQNIPVTALTDLFVNGNTAVGGCDSAGDPCAAGTINGSLVPWSRTFDAAQLHYLGPDFATGSLDFSAVQNSFGAVIVGAPVLDIEVAKTPEPSYLFAVAGGMLAMAALRRRR